MVASPGLGVAVARFNCRRPARPAPCRANRCRRHRRCCYQLVWTVCAGAWISLNIVVSGFGRPPVKAGSPSRNALAPKRPCLCLAPLRCAVTSLRRPPSSPRVSFAKVVVDWKASLLTALCVAARVNCAVGAVCCGCCCGCVCVWGGAGAFSGAGKKLFDWLLKAVS